MVIKLCNTQFVINCNNIYKKKKLRLSGNAKSIDTQIDNIKV